MTARGYNNKGKLYFLCGSCRDVIAGQVSFFKGSVEKVSGREPQRLVAKTS
jgi:hypothetical protein